MTTKEMKEPKGKPVLIVRVYETPTSQHPYFFDARWEMSKVAWYEWGGVVPSIPECFNNVVATLKEKEGMREMAGVRRKNGK